ncbi:MAG TPA: hypothetical protein VFR85_06505 [Anaeromyxobacteraceae bacterium]|nr:hypothetical protein [Anaeromyxobacteraceae bacterium]
MLDGQQQQQLRERLANLIGARGVRQARRRPVDVVVHHAEICNRHGTGVLIQRLFGSGPEMVAIRSQNHYGGHQRFGEAGFLISHGAASRPDVYATVLETLRGTEVRRAIAIPFYADDARTAIALKDAFAPPLCTYIMDDQNIECRGIPDDVLRELLAKSELRLAISPELRAEYQRKFGLRFWVLPPVVEADLICPRPSVPDRQVLAERRGVIVGNVWGRRWLIGLCDILRGTGIRLDWYASSGLQWSPLSASELAEAGVHVRSPLPEPELTRILRGSAYVVHPSGTLDEYDTHRAIARLSLPSKVPYVLATSHTPVLVIGHPETAAARFVRAMGTGLAIPYRRASLVHAVGELTDPAVQARMRARAADLASGFSSAGVGQWIWRSLEAGRAADDRFEQLLGPTELPPSPTPHQLPRP